MSDEIDQLFALQLQFHILGSSKIRRLLPQRHIPQGFALDRKSVV